MADTLVAETPTNAKPTELSHADQISNLATELQVMLSRVHTISRMVRVLSDDIECDGSLGKLHRMAVNDIVNLAELAESVANDASEKAEKIEVLIRHLK